MKSQSEFALDQRFWKYTRSNIKNGKNYLLVKFCDFFESYLKISQYTILLLFQCDTATVAYQHIIHQLKRSARMSDSSISGKEVLPFLGRVSCDLLLKGSQNTNPNTRSSLFAYVVIQFSNELEIIFFAISILRQ